MSQNSDNDEKPLDPAAERVRRRLVRFMAINLGILFIAVMAVLVAIVYKTGMLGSGQEAAIRTPPLADGPMMRATISLPEGARLLGHGLSGDRLTLDAELAEGGRAIFLYDIGQERIVARFDIAAGQP